MPFRVVIIAIRIGERFRVLKTRLDFDISPSLPHLVYMPNTASRAIANLNCHDVQKGNPLMPSWVMHHATRQFTIRSPGERCPTKEPRTVTLSLSDWVMHRSAKSPMGIMNSNAAVILWLFTPAILDKHGNGYGCQVLTHSSSESFDGRISMKFHSQQIKDHCRNQYVPCLQGVLRLAQCLAIVLVKIWLILCNPGFVQGQLNEIKGLTIAYICFRSPFEISSMGHNNVVDSEYFLTITKVASFERLGSNSVTSDSTATPHGYAAYPSPVSSTRPQITSMRPSSHLLFFVTIDC